jgi:hypothetical protein
MKDYLLKSSFALFIFTSSYLIAEPDFYGKINVSYENAKKKALSRILDLKTMHQGLV